MIKILKAAIAPFYSAVHTCPRIAREPSYYPDAPRKCLLRRYFEIVYQRFVTRSTNLFYNAYGMDCIGYSNPRDYITERDFWTNVINKNYSGSINHGVVLRDKYLFAVFMKAHGLPTPDILAWANSGRFYIGSDEVEFHDWQAHLLAADSLLFLKEALSCCAKGVARISSREFSFSADYFADNKFIVQKALSNCAEIDAIQPNSVNTLRIVTIASQRTKTIELLSPGGLRVGGGSAVDNWAKGGLFVGINEDGRLQKYGYYKPGMHQLGRSDVQPSTGFKFEGFNVPYYGDAVALVKKAHSFLPEVTSIGWDVALTTEGPMLIEGNDDYEVSLMQMVAGGLKNRYKELGVI